MLFDKAIKQTFKSKIDSKLVLLTGGIIAAVIVGGFIVGHGLKTLLILSPAILFAAQTIFGISYTVHDNILVINSGLFLYRKIEVERIRKIQSSRSWQSGPASSLDRIEVFYDKFESVMVSPKDKQQFIDALLNINPNIEVILSK